MTFDSVSNNENKKLGDIDGQIDIFADCDTSNQTSSRKKYQRSHGGGGGVLSSSIMRIVEGTQKLREPKAAKAAAFGQASGKGARVCRTPIQTQGVEHHCLLAVGGVDGRVSLIETATGNACPQPSTLPPPCTEPWSQIFSTLIPFSPGTLTIDLLKLIRPLSKPRPQIFASPPAGGERDVRGVDGRGVEAATAPGREGSSWPPFHPLHYLNRAPPSNRSLSNQHTRARPNRALRRALPLRALPRIHIPRRDMEGLRH